MDTLIMFMVSQDPMVSAGIPCVLPKNFIQKTDLYTSQIIIYCGSFLYGRDVKGASASFIHKSDLSLRKLLMFSFE